MQTVDINKELYIPILGALNIEVDPNGQLMMKYPDRIAAATVNKRNLLLPTQEVLRAVPENALVFHPLSENVARGDSPIQNYLKKLVTFKVTFAISYLAQQLYSLAADQKRHASLNGEQLAILSILPEADKKGEANLSRILESIDMDKVKIFNVFNKRSGTIGGNTYNRVAVASFPLLDEMNSPADTLWGHRDVRKRDSKDFRALFDYILPEWNVKDKYSAASDSMESPSFHALMMALVNVMTPLNRIAKIYGNLLVEAGEDGEKIDMAPYVSADLEFQHRLSNLSKYRNLVPAMDGNAGEPLAGSVEAQEVVQNPRSVAPAFMKQNLGDDINVPTPQVNTLQNPPQQMPAQQQAVYNQAPQQQPQVQQPAPAVGVAGFGSYNTQTAQARPMQQQYGSYGTMPAQGQVMQQSGVAGFGSYGGTNPGVTGWGNGGFPQQQQQTTTPSVFDSWNQTAMGQQQGQQLQQMQNVNPFTVPSPPATVQQPYGSYGSFGSTPQGQWVVTPNGQQVYVNQFGQPIQPPAPQQGQQYFGTMPAQGQVGYQANPFVPQQQQVGFRTY